MQERAGVNTPQVKVVRPDDWEPSLPLVDGEGLFCEIVGLGAGTRARGLYFIKLSAGARTVPLRHHGEATYYVLAGTGQIHDFDADASLPLVEGSMIHVRPGTTYGAVTLAGMKLIGGPCPVDPHLRATSPRAGRVDDATPRVRVFHRDRPGRMVPFISNDARLVVWLGEGARTANMNYVVLQPGERNTEHVHRYSEDTIYIVSGRGTAEDVTNGRKLEVESGDTVQIPPGVWHAVAADRGETLVSVGGPCPADLDMLRAIGVDVAEYVDDEERYIAEVGFAP